MTRLSLYLSLIFIVISNFSYSQNDQRILQIRKIVNEINAESNYNIKHLENDYFIDVKNEIADGGQDLKGFYKNGNLKKIIYSVGLSFGVTTMEFYYLNNSLQFVYEQQKVYSQSTNAPIESIELDYSKTQIIYEGRFYFDKLKLFQSIIEGNKMFENSEDKNLQKNLFSASKALIKELNEFK